MKTGPLETIARLGLPAAKGVLQVGASNGQEVEYFKAHGIAYAALIEPLPGVFAHLQQRCAQTPGYLPVQALCGSEDGKTVNFYVSSNNGESSSILTPKDHLSLFPWVSFPTQVEMVTFTLDRVFMAITAARPEIASAIDFLMIDAQGAELEVLRGAGAVLGRIAYIYTEVGFGDGYEGAVELEALMDFLKPLGFRVHDLHIQREGFGDALFIRRPYR